MNMNNLIGAIAVIVVGMPWVMKSLSDGSINLNGLLVNLVSTVQEIVTRQPATWDAPETRPQPSPATRDGL